VNTDWRRQPGTFIPRETPCVNGDLDLVIGEPTQVPLRLTRELLPRGGGAAGPEVSDPDYVLHRLAAYSPVVGSV